MNATSSFLAPLRNHFFAFSLNFLFPLWLGLILLNDLRGWTPLSLRCPRVWRAARRRGWRRRANYHSEPFYWRMSCQWCQFSPLAGKRWFLIKISLVQAFFYAAICNVWHLINDAVRLPALIILLVTFSRSTYYTWSSNLVRNNTKIPCRSSDN